MYVAVLAIAELRLVEFCVLSSDSCLILNDLRKKLNSNNYSLELVNSNIANQLRRLEISSGVLNSAQAFGDQFSFGQM
jgi:hypothetical protein